MFLIKNLISAAIAFSISYILTPFTIPLCKTIGAYDKPDGKRKINTEPIPRLGGLGFYLATLIILFPLVSRSDTVAALLCGGTVLIIGGIADDTFNISPAMKLFIQGAAALVALAFIGIPDEMSFFGIFRIPLIGVIGFLLAFFRLMFTVNAVNFSDGLDGLASGISIIALFSLWIYGTVNSSTYPSVAALILAFAILGFLPYNKYRAKVFMGDCGSQFLGLSIALLALGNSKEGSFNLETTLFLAVPTADTVLSVLRRLIRKRKSLDHYF